MKKGEIKIKRATQAQTRKAMNTLAKQRGCSAAQVLKDELAAHKRSSGRGKLYRADILGKKVVTSRKVLDEKYGRAAAECFAKINAEVCAAMAQEAAQDITGLEQKLAFAEVCKRHERSKREKAERTAGRLAVRVEELEEMKKGMEYIAVRGSAQLAQSVPVDEPYPVDELYTKNEALIEMRRRMGKGATLSDRNFYKKVKKHEFGIKRIKRKGSHPVYWFPHKGLDSK